MVRSSSVVLPAPGELIRLMARMPRSASQRRLWSARATFFARICCSRTIVRSLFVVSCGWGSWSWSWWWSGCGWLWAWVLAGSSVTRVPESSPQPHVAHMSGHLHRSDQHFLTADHLYVRASARAEQDRVRQGEILLAGQASGAAFRLVDLQRCAVKG